MGTVAPTVHAGARKYCEVFLPEFANYDPALKSKLKDSIGEMLGLCKEALEINANLIGPEQLNFHEMLEGKFQEFSTMFKKEYDGKIKDRLALSGDQFSEN